jgi:hypothetical protein
MIDTKYTDPFAPWNNPAYRNDPFAPHNDPSRRDSPFEAWNSPIGSEQDLSDDDRRFYGLRDRSND